VLASVQGRPVSVIAHMFAATEGYVREVIHAFNDTGFAALDPNAAALARPGSLSEFLQMFFRDDFKIDNRPDGLTSAGCAPASSTAWAGGGGNTQRADPRFPTQPRTLVIRSSWRWLAVRESW
jgi:hypothetical protein